jgi:hypothetical protein
VKRQQVGESSKATGAQQVPPMGCHSVSFFDFKLNQMPFGLVSNLKNQSHLFLV